MVDSSWMAREIAEIPAAAERQMAETAALLAVADRIRAFAPRIAIFCGRGSSGHVGVFLRYVSEARLGIIGSAAAPSLVTAYHARPDMREALFVVISQSGRSPDIVAATAEARQLGALTLALVNEADAPVARAAEFVLPILAGAERAVAATKTVVLSMLAGARLVAALSKDHELGEALARLPERLGGALGCDWSAWAESLGSANAAFVTARGYTLGTAREIALKLVESLRLPALAYSAAELRHGPRASVTRATPVLVLRVNDQTAESVDALVRDLENDRVGVFVVGGPRASLPWIADDHPVCDAIAMLAPAYRAIEATVRGSGLDPDHPPHLSKVTKTL